MVAILEGKPLTSEDIVNTLPQSVRERIERSVDALEKLLSREIQRASQTGSVDPASLSEILDGFLRSLESTGAAGAIYSAPELINEVVEKLEQKLKRGELPADRVSAERVLDSVREANEKIREFFNSSKFKRKVVESIDPTRLSPSEWNRIIDRVMDTDLYRAGRGEGGGILDALMSKILVSPQFRFRLKEYLRDLRVAPAVRESYHPIGKVVDPRRTFRETSRTGLPILVFKKPIVKPRTREDIIFLYDVSGSMESLYAMIVSIAQALSELGLNVKVWYAEEGAVKAVSRDFVRELERFGGGGTNLAEATRRVLREEQLRDTVFIVYSDLMEGGDEEEFLSNLEKIRSRGSKVAVFVTDCSNYGISYALDRIRSMGFYLKCDVRSPRSFLEGLRELKPYIKKAAVIR